MQPSRFLASSAKPTEDEGRTQRSQPRTKDELSVANRAAACDANLLSAEHKCTDCFVAQNAPRNDEENRFRKHSTLLQAQGAGQAEQFAQNEDEG